MSRVVDNLIAYRVLSMLVKPFVETDAFKFGIIDKNGKKLKEPSTEEEKDSYDYLSRLTFNLKKILNKLPGGDSKLKTIVAALYLIKEQWYSKSDVDTINESELLKILNLNIILAEETIQYQMFLEDGVGGAIVGQGQVVPATQSATPTNHTGVQTSTTEPVVRKKKPPMVRRQSMKPVVVDINQKAL